MISPQTTVLTGADIKEAMQRALDAQNALKTFRQRSFVIEMKKSFVEGDCRLVSHLFKF